MNSNMPCHTIHHLESSDWRRFRAIRLRALEDSPDAFGSTLERETAFSREDWTLRLNRSDVATFVASRDDRVDQIDIGLVTCAPYDQYAGLYSMWVAPEARGTGIGSSLIDAVIAWARQEKLGKLLLDVANHNLPAIALYESKGFLPTGITGTLPPPREHITEHQRELLL